MGLGFDSDDFHFSLKRNTHHYWGTSCCVWRRWCKITAMKSMVWIEEGSMGSPLSSFTAPFITPSTLKGGRRSDEGKWVSEGERKRWGRRAEREKVVGVCHTQCTLLQYRDTGGRQAAGRGDTVWPEESWRGAEEGCQSCSHATSSHPTCPDGEAPSLSALNTLTIRTVELIFHNEAFYYSKMLFSCPLELRYLLFCLRVLWGVLRQACSPHQDWGLRLV